MKVVFYVRQDESDVYEFPDDVSEAELQDAANQWVVDNVGSWYEIVDEE